MAAVRELQRASDRDRDAVADRLRVAASEGRLSPEELDERLSRTFAATTYGELDLVTDDLPVPVRARPAATPAKAGFWRRFGAALIDGIIVALVGAIVGHLLHGAGNWTVAVVSIVYFVTLEGGPRGAGAGKQAMGIRVADARTGAPIGHRRAFVRWVGAILSTLFCLLGYFWMLWDPQRQCWHDKLAGDVVVFTDGRTELEQARRPR